MKGWLAGALAALTLALAWPAGATTALPTRPGFDTLSGCPSPSLTPCWKPWDATNPLPVTGTFSATFSGFQPTPAYSQLAVGATSTRVALPAGTVVIVYNTGANAASVTLGNGSVVATGANDIIQPNSWVAFTVGSFVDIAGIEATGAAGTTTLVISGGAGLPTGAGGGGGSGGGGAATTPFVPGATPIASFTATTANTTTSIPSGATTLVVTSVSSTPNIAHCTLGAGPAVITDLGIQPGESVAFNVTSATQFSCVTSSGSQLLGAVAGSGAFQATAGNGATNTAAGTSATSALGVQGVTGGVPLPISGSVTASFSQFAPNGNYSTPLTVGASSSRTALPSGGGTTVAIYNTGSNAAFVALGSSSVVATASNDQVAPGNFLCLAVGSNVDIAAIETTGATTLNVSGGSGGCASSGGGNVSTLSGSNLANLLNWGSVTAGSATGNNGVLVMGADGGGNAQSLPSGANVTPINCSSSTSTANTAQNLANLGTSSIHGFTIQNESTTEVMWVSFTGTASAGAVGSFYLPAATATTFTGGGTYTTPPGFGSNTNVSWVAATLNHPVSCVGW